jgi:hypothetical protein
MRHFPYTHFQIRGSVLDQNPPNSSPELRLILRHVKRILLPLVI